MNAAHALEMSALSALRTGVPWLDMLMGMAVMGIVSLAVAWASTGWNWLVQRARGLWSVGYVTRTIDFEEGSSSLIYNYVLMLAIDTAIAKRCPALSDYKLYCTLRMPSEEGLGDYCIRKKLHAVAWTSIGSGIEVCINETIERTTTDARHIRHAYHLRARSAAVLDSFVSQAVDDYYRLVTKSGAKTRYCYRIRSCPKQSEFRDPAPVVFPAKRYPIVEDAKTFASMFFAEKTRVMALVKHFQDRTGPFKAGMREHQINFLLHGPPGTGKTSMARAIAHATGRSMVLVDLHGLRTTDDLFEVLNSPVVTLATTGTTTTTTEISPDEVVYVVEEIDTFKGMHRRTLAEQPAPDLSTAEALYNAMQAKKDESAIGVGAFLQVFDGVVPAAGRIIVLTTNYIDKLDEALTRPGRMYCVPVGYATPDTASDLLKYRFDAALTPALEARVRAVVAEHNVTPALLEELCINHFDNVKKLVSVLEKSV